MLNDARLLSDDGRFDAVQGAIVAAPDGGMAFRLDAAKNFTRKPPDDAVLLAGLSDDPAQRQPTTLAYVDYLNRFAALGGDVAGQRAVVLPAPVADHLHR